MTPEQEEVQQKWKTRAFKTWSLVGACILIGVIIYVCGIIQQAVAVVVVTALATFLMHGMVQRLDDKGVPRAAAVAIAVLGVSLAIFGCLVAFVPALVNQITMFTGNMSTYTAQTTELLRLLGEYLGSDAEATMISAFNEFMTWFRQQAGTIASGLAGGILGGAASVGNVFMVSFISLICTFWILLDLPKLTAEIRSLFNEKYQDDIDIFTDAFGTAVYGWARSTLLCAAITGVVSGLCFWIAGIPYASTLGVIAALMYLIPYIGSMITCVVVAIIALFVSPVTAIISIVINVVINNVVGNIISPRLMKSSVSVHPALILVAILVGSALGGIPGMLLSIPIVGAVQGVFVTYFEANTGRTIATEDGALFQKQKEVTLSDIADTAHLGTGKFHLPGSKKDK